MKTNSKKFSLRPGSQLPRWDSLNLRLDLPKSHGQIQGYNSAIGLKKIKSSETRLHPALENRGAEDNQGAS